MPRLSLDNKALDERSYMHLRSRNNTIVYLDASDNENETAFGSKENVSDPPSELICINFIKSEPQSDSENESDNHKTIQFKERLCKNSKKRPPVLKTLKNKKHKRRKFAKCRTAVRKVVIQPSKKKTLIQKRKCRETIDFQKENGKFERNGKSFLLSQEESAKPFVQGISCYNDMVKFPKCLECLKVAVHKTAKDVSNTSCRFLEYRKLIAAKNDTFMSAGFLQPSDSREDDFRLWIPNLTKPPENLTIQTAKELLIQVGDQFCDLIQQEKGALSLHCNSNKTMTWKKSTEGVREMCDVCDTTLFNIHWVCPKCGFSVCIDCYKVRKQGAITDPKCQIKSKDSYLWLLCHSKIPHDQKQLVMAQIIPGNALWVLNDCVHKVREKWKIAASCKCSPRDKITAPKWSIDKITPLMNIINSSFSSLSINGDRQSANDVHFFKNNIPNFFTNTLANDFYIGKSLKNGVIHDEMAGICYESCDYIDSVVNATEVDPPSLQKTETESEVIRLICESSKKFNLEEFNDRYPKSSSNQDTLPLRVLTSIESAIPFKHIAHSWLCNGRLLLLHHPSRKDNLELFQEQWKRGQPVMVTGVNEELDVSLWNPDGFCNDFGHIKNDLVDCRKGIVIGNLPMRKFWLGFENLDRRLKDESGEHMLLKLKDWPPGEDFSEKLPKRFQDLMKGLPLPEYTHRDGIFNLAGRLPSWFVRPDLGPKMYNAYGSALYPSTGTTNLHLDISDAVNVMVYVGIPHDGKYEQHIDEALKAIDEGGCDSLMRERVTSKGAKPGALWHIYDSRNVDKIREFLSKVTIERNERLEANDDPIHDQSWYLDFELRKRLYNEYGVQGYAIAQCLGDAVFIPAGAPHQVRNLHSCVKVAEDFVSPENVVHCFKLTEEFRHLSDTHTNREDKLQIKNIIYHVVKDALSHLLEETDDFHNILMSKTNHS